MCCALKKKRTRGRDDFWCSFWLPVWRLGAGMSRAMNSARVFCFYLVLLFSSSFCLGQGTLNFNTAVNATSVIRYAPCTPLGGSSGLKIDGSRHPTAQAAVYAGPAGSTEAQLVMIAPAAGFVSGATAGYVTAGSRTISFLPQGYVGAVVQIRAWDSFTFTARSYEEAIQQFGYFGKSPIYTITEPLGGPGDPQGTPPVTAAHIPDQVGFDIGEPPITCPEPSARSLFGFALLGVWFYRLRNKNGLLFQRKDMNVHGMR
ncbi:MAG: hypothetical protein JWM16_2099 [Verrucomicrobiales bacterium]|nr:hypothetical protein [Verrucomicrobiales bacterium]